MSVENFSLKHILGLKVNDLRIQKKLSFQELSTKSGLSISYLSEIEKGKKYPKGDKMMALANALGVTYDQLVSLKVSKKLSPIIGLLQSDIFKEFPLELFGLDPQKIMELVSANPEKINAFIQSISAIARNYEMRGEHFYYAALRSYQEFHDNYFPELEKAASKVRKSWQLDHLPLNVEDIEAVLKGQYGLDVDRNSLSKYESLRDLRSLNQSNKDRILLHAGLTKAQEAFLLGRELAFRILECEERPMETPPQKSYSFEALLNNYKASYFSAALIMPEKSVVEDVKLMASSNKWDDKLFAGFIDKYAATPEMLMQRLTNILPKHFGLKNLFFLRFVGTDDFSNYRLTKELHLSKAHNPHSNGLNESYCRRWLSIRLLKQLRTSSKVTSTNGLLVGAQVSHYYDTDDDYLCLTMAFPNISNPLESISVTIGFYVDDHSRKRINFISDKAIKTRTVNTTCQRCAWTDCEDRVAPPTVIEDITRSNKILSDLDEMLNEV